MNKKCKSCGTENYHEFLSCEFCGKAMTEEELVYWAAYYEVKNEREKQELNRQRAKTR